jgi:uncharacterized membrane protein
LVPFSPGVHWCTSCDAIVPSWVPGTARQVVYGSGVAELACSLLVAARRTRRFGGYAAAVLFVGVFPANLKMAADGGVPGGEGPMASKGFAYARLPLQLPLVRWGLRVGRAA